MREDLKQLLKVQALDINIRELEGRKLATIRGLEELRNEVENEKKAGGGEKPFDG